jgi:hypothetical protein
MCEEIEAEVYGEAWLIQESQKVEMSRKEDRWSGKVAR